MSWRAPAEQWRRLPRIFQETVGLDVLTARSAQLAFYFMLALFPFLLSISAILGSVLAESTTLRTELLSALDELVPSTEVSEIVDRVLDEIQIRGTGTAFWLGLLLSVWAASSGLMAMHNAIDTIFGMAERPAWLRRRLLAVPQTLVLGLTVVSALLLLFYSQVIGNWLGQRFPAVAAVVSWLEYLRWPLLIVSALLSFDLIYNSAPSRRRHGNAWISPGAVVALLLWFLVSQGFRLYVTTWAAFSRLYGSLGSVVVMLLWFYFSALSFLLGVALNACLEVARQRADEPAAAGLKDQPSS